MSFSFISPVSFTTLYATSFTTSYFIISQCPPLSGPTRRMTPSAWRALVIFAIARLVTPIFSAISDVVTFGFSWINSIIFCELFCELFCESFMSLAVADTGRTNSTSSTSILFFNSGSPQPVSFQAAMILGKPEPMFSPKPIFLAYWLKACLIVQLAIAQFRSGVIV